jgi:hypothetical protein
MKRIRFILIVSLFSTCGLAGCATPARFEWGSYDASLYAYSKRPDQLSRYEDALEAAIEKGRADGRLAPGLQAELGYCYLGEGKRKAAIELFESEMKDFPESRPFLSRIIMQNAG